MSVTVRHRNPGSLKRAYRTMVGQTNREVAVGFPAGIAQAYPDGTPVAEVAASHVFGLGVPKRDFMGLAKDEITHKTAPIIRAALSAENKEPLYEAAGLSAQTAIQRAIVALDEPPNSPATIAAKKSSNPLVDTGHMLESVTYVVRERIR